MNSRGESKEVISWLGDFKNNISRRINVKKRIIAFLCLCVMALSIFPCVPEKAMAAEEFYELKNGQVITLKNASSGWFMNLQHGTDANGTKINVYPWDETPPYTQKYKVSLNADGSFKLATLCAPSRFVDVRRYSKPLAESQGIVIWAEDGDTHKHLRLKKVGDKVAIVFANNTNLCIAPSSVSAAKTTQTQMIVRKLDTSKTEMLWNVCDEKGNPINTCGSSNLGDLFSNFKEIWNNVGEMSASIGEGYVCLKITHCASNKVLKKVNDKLMLADYEIDDENCFFVYGNNTLLNMAEIEVVSLLGSNGSLVEYRSAGSGTNPVKLVEMGNGVYGITTTVGNRVFAVDVSDGCVDRPLQTWEFDQSNPNQRFYIEIIEPSEIRQERESQILLNKIRNGESITLQFLDSTTGPITIKNGDIWPDDGAGYGPGKECFSFAQVVFYNLNRSKLQNQYLATSIKNHDLVNYSTIANKVYSKSKPTSSDLSELTSILKPGDYIQAWWPYKDGVTPHSMIVIDADKISNKVTLLDANRVSHNKIDITEVNLAAFFETRKKRSTTPDWGISVYRID